MSTTPEPEPTLGTISSMLEMLRLEVQVARLETKADISTLRLEFNTRTGETKERLDSLGLRLTTLFDELAAFRSEYNVHIHPRDDSA